MEKDSLDAADGVDVGYTVITASGVDDNYLEELDDLEVCVVEMLKQGYKLAGGVSHSVTVIRGQTVYHYAQALYK